MPTGYTHGVQTGEVKDFKEYALTCARAFGACVMLRDEPLSSDIPEFESLKHYAPTLEGHYKELKKIKEATDEECQKMIEEEYDKKMEYYFETLNLKRTERKRYEDMLEQAKEFVPPTPDHEEYAEFLISQLEDSIEWDCSEEHINPPEKLSVEDWREDRIGWIQDSIDFYEKLQADDIERVKKSNEWVRELKKALGV